jgi:hypothetical protein
MLALTPISTQEVDATLPPDRCASWLGAQRPDLLEYSWSVITARYRCCVIWVLDDASLICYQPGAPPSCVRFAGFGKGQAVTGRRIQA